MPQVPHSLRLLNCCFLLLATVVLSSGQALADPRQPILAGAWYPEDPEALRESVAKYIEKAEFAPLSGELLGLVAPHAGHVYSGGVAGYAYSALQQQPADIVVIVAPSHHHFFHGVSVHDPGGYATPLGVMQLDQDFIALLRKRMPDLKYVPEAHTREHSIEIQIPFLQLATPDARLVPLVMGQQDFDICRRLARALAYAVRKTSGRKVVLLASSDLSHFHDKQTCARLDGRIHQAIQEMDYRGIARCLSEKTCEACGAGPMVSVMLAAQELGANQGLLLATGDSGDVTGDKDKVVGYMAAAFVQAAGNAGSTNTNPPPSAVATRDGNGEYSPKERELLHQIAREAVRSKFQKTHYVPPLAVPESLREKRGAFVTVKIDGRLRGCIGHVLGRDPLVMTVAAMAQAAAFEDPRFPPVGEEEINALEYEISVLTPPQRILDPLQVQAGRHGLIMRNGPRQGLLLPQVATEYGWSREEFLAHTCEKARMASDCWQNQATEIYVFSAEVF